MEIHAKWSSISIREWDSHKRGQYDYVTYSLMLMPFTLHYIHKTAIASFNVIELQTALLLYAELSYWGYGKVEKNNTRRMVGGWYLKSHQFCLLINIATFIRYEGVPYFYTKMYKFLCVWSGKKRVEVKGSEIKKKKFNLCSCFVKALSTSFFKFNIFILFKLNDYRVAEGRCCCRKKKFIKI